jgi:hypothetical protein
VENPLLSAFSKEGFSMAFRPLPTGAIISMKIWRRVMFAFCTKCSLPAGLEIAKAVRRDLRGWIELLAGMA